MQNNVTTQEITGCETCPFRYHEYDDFAVGADSLEICSLALNSNLDNYFIDVFDSKKEEHSELVTPKWCPIKDKPLLLKFQDEN